MILDMVADLRRSVREIREDAPGAAQKTAEWSTDMAGSMKTLHGFVMREAASTGQLKEDCKHMTSPLEKLTDRDLKVLDDLRWACDRAPIGWDGWVRPMDCGGRDGSDHSYRLRKLANLDLVERRKVTYRSARYKITVSGRGLLNRLEDRP